MSKKHSYVCGELFRMPNSAPVPYDGETRFRVVKVLSKASVEATPHQKEKGKLVFTAKVKELVWCPPVTREKYRATKKAAKASTALAVNEEPEIPGDELPDFSGALLE